MKDILFEKIKEYETYNKQMQSSVNKEEKKELMSTNLEILEEIKKIVENSIGDICYLISKQSYRD